MGADASLPAGKKQWLRVSRWYPGKSSFCPAVVFKGIQLTVAFGYCAQSSTLMYCVPDISTIFDVDISVIVSS